MQKHFVHFFSPGTFCPEESVREIPAWDVEAAVESARTIVERHGAKPYAFQFVTRERAPNDLDSKISVRSPMYYLGGVLYTYEEVVARNDPKEEILRWNMKTNNIGTIIQNDNSWRFVGEFHPGDILLHVTL